MTERDDLVSQRLVAGRPSPTDGSAAACDGVRSLTAAEADEILRNAPVRWMSTLPEVATALANTIDMAVAAHENRGRGGMQVPYHGDFANAPPSVIVRLRWWSRELRAALARTVAGQVTGKDADATAPVGPDLLKPEAHHE
jgi:hypothetical protein